MDRGQLVNDAERRLWDAFTHGEQVDIGPGEPTDGQFDPAQWGDDRIVRAEVIARLLLGVRDGDSGYIAKVWLAGARITGVLYLNGGTTSYELHLERCWLDQPPDLRNAKTRYLGAISCRLAGLVAHGWQADGPARFDRSKFVGAINLEGAKVGGHLDMSGATLTSPDGKALTAENLTVEQNLVCGNGFTAMGAIILTTAKVGGHLDMSSATLTSPGGIALMAQNLTVERSMVCTDGFTATGMVDLLGTTIGGQLNMSGATLTNPGGKALQAYNLTVKKGMFCGDGFTATGTVDLLGTTVGGQLGLIGATLTNPDGIALRAQDLTVERGIYCDGLTATGTVDLFDATVGALYMFDATLKLPARADKNTYVALVCRGVTAKTLTLPTALPGITDLRRATIGVLTVSASALNTHMQLSGLTYTDLDPDPDPPVRQRLAWLGGDPDGYHPQPYEQLAAYYRDNGHDPEARRVLLAKRRARRATNIGSDSPWRWFPSLIVDILAGYGYAPGRAFAWLLTALGLGTWLLLSAAPANPTHNRHINALLLALDAILPTSPLGIRETAALTGSAYITAMALQGFGFAMSLAVLPALTRSLARGDK